MKSKDEAMSTILTVLTQVGPQSPAQLATRLKRTRQSIHLYLRQLTNNGLVEKQSFSSHKKDLHYRLVEKKPIENFLSSPNNQKLFKAYQEIKGNLEGLFSKEKLLYLDSRFSYIDESYQIQEGAQGFLQRFFEKNHNSISNFLKSKRRKKDNRTAKHLIESEIKRYFDQRMTIDQHLFRQDLNVYSLKHRLESIYENIEGGSYLNEVFISDFDSFHPYGKTKLGNLVFLSKVASQHSDAYINEITRLIRNDILAIIRAFSVKNVVWLPHTINRKIQLIDSLQVKISLTSSANHNIKEIKASKRQDIVLIPQKSISSLDERLTNADMTLTVDSSHLLNVDMKSSILVIDDSIGSGASIRAISHKLRQQRFKNARIIGYAITGSMKGELGEKDEP